MIPKAPNDIVGAEIATDAWIHPLDGPVRRMRIRDGRVFGVQRPGDRPDECRSGHCGVDIGGEVGAEPVHAAHDGIVDRVQRGPNDDHGGLYVRIAHCGGTPFTQYFHLAAIPKRIVPGLHVRLGELVGLVGDTGSSARRRICTSRCRSSRRRGCPSRACRSVPAARRDRAAFAIDATKRRRPISTTISG